MNVTEQVIMEQFGFWQPTRVEASLKPVEASLKPGILTAIVGCGTSYYLAQTLAAVFNRRGKAAIAVPGSEWLNHFPAHVAGGSVQVVALSRSGETSETLAAARWSRAQGHFVLGITCAPGSSLVAASDQILELPTHPLEGIVMTVSASLMLLEGMRLAGVEIPRNLSAQAEAVLEGLEPKLNHLVKQRSHFVFLGSGELYGIANEGALKAQEMSISLVQAYHPMEYRHGPVSMVEPGVLAILLYHPDQLASESQIARELQAKGATVLALGGPGDISVDLGQTDAALRAMLCLPVLQLLGERIAQAKGLDSTAPRHLTKVVML
jgi:glucosamine--fructose-6-phosphate aminotransferase (isomerizing)